MITKKPRNKKIDNKEQCKILFRNEIDANLLTDIEKAAILTGMEDVEKEEVHLKQVLAKNEGHIPTPKIQTVQHSSPFQNYQKPAKLIKYTENFKNDYILSEEDRIFIQSLQITDSHFLINLDKLKAENERFIKFHTDFEHIFIDTTIDQRLRDYIQNRILLLHDLKILNAYACFRRYIIKTARNHRRTEAHTIEKIKALYHEINCCQNILELTRKKYEYQLESNELRFQAIEIAQQSVGLYKNAGLSLRKFKKDYIDHIIGRKKAKKTLPFYKKIGFRKLRKDEGLIVELQQILRDIKVTEDEVDSTYNLMKEFIHLD